MTADKGTYRQLPQNQPHGVEVRPGPRNWLRVADVEDGHRPGTPAGESVELRELKRRNRLLEQENEVLRRAAAYLSQANLPGK